MHFQLSYIEKIQKKSFKNFRDGHEYFDKKKPVNDISHECELNRVVEYHRKQHKNPRT